MMKALRIGTTLFFILTLVTFVLFYTKEQNNIDTTYPIIQVPDEVLEVSIDADESQLLCGVTAYDGKDGDITEKVMVESISKFTDENTCVVTYVVMDDDKHVAKSSRTLYFKDYAPPQFYLKQSLVFTLGEKVDVREIVGAVDPIDGDISDKVSIIATDYTGNTAGVFTLSLQASNSMGDIIYMDLPIYVEEKNSKAPVIELSEYLIYLKKGETPAFEDYISSITSDGRPAENYNMMISTNFNSQQAGTYSVHFDVETSAGHEGHCILTAIVEE